MPRPLARCAGARLCGSGLRGLWGPNDLGRPPATCRRASPAASGPPRSRSAVHRRSGSLGSPVRADSIGAVEVGEHEDVEQLGAGSGPRASRRAWSRCSRSSGRIMCLPSPITPRGRDHARSKASRLSFEREGRQSAVTRLSCKRFLLRRTPQEQTMVRGTVRFKKGYRA
jgi:hypothetical protein